MNEVYPNPASATTAAGRRGRRAGSGPQPRSPEKARRGSTHSATGRASSLEPRSATRPAAGRSRTALHPAVGCGRLLRPARRTGGGGNGSGRGAVDEQCVDGLRFLYAGPLFDAVSVEKSGFRGMRMLIASELITRQLRTTFRHPIGNRSFIPFRRLNHSQYPGRISEGYHDVLWMFSPDEAEWRDRKRLMSSRLRWSGNDPEEFVQAAATQLVFSECQAILTTLQGRRRRRRSVS